MLCHSSRFISVLGMIAFGVAAIAQQPGQTPDSTAAKTEEPTRIQVDVTRVNLLVTVTDRKGRFITDLAKHDFEVIENKIPQVIQEFTAETNLPLRLAILVDISGSIRDRFKFEQEAAIEFLNSVVHRDQDKALVISFDSVPKLVADFTDDAEKLDEAIRGLRPGGGTSLYDAIYFACQDKLQQDQPRDKFRRALVILSDGDDNQSWRTRDQALEMAQKADVVIYGISTNTSRGQTSGDKVMRYFSQETGGRAFFPFKVDDLEQSFDSIANELRHQYNIFYRPEPLRTDGQFHQVDLRVKTRKDLIVRARKGYYAPRF